MRDETRFALLITLCGIGLLLIAACGPVPAGSAVTPLATSVVTMVTVTSGGGTTTDVPDVTAVPSGSVTPVSVGSGATPSGGATVISGATAAPATTAAATRSAYPVGTAAPPSNGLSEADLKYRLIAQFGDIFYCDPDQYPVARGGDQGPLAANAVATLKQKDPATYQGILKFLNLAPSATLDSAQTLAVYRESKRLNALPLTPTGDGYKFALRIADTSSGRTASGFAIEGTVSKQGEIAVTKREAASLQCPICLAADARIDTPVGPVAVSALQVGMPVWTQDASGKRVAGVVVQAAHVAVPATHQVVRLRLEDGRELRVSPGHPTADGRHVADLAAGDAYDGSHVASANLEAYPDGATYDLLPSGERGTYWANGILLGSTLR